MRTLILSLSLIFAISPCAQAIEVMAPQVYMVDFNTGAVLYEKNADQPMAPSSMSKIMTAYLVFDRIKHGDVKLDDMFHVSDLAWKMGGSKMFVNVNSQVSVEDLLKGAIVQSGNDACVVLAEGLSGSEAAFAAEATQKAHEMGAKNSTFTNSTGWPDERHLTTAKDLAIIAEKTIRDFPKEYKEYYSLRDYTYNKITQQNRNSLLAKNMGADGMKTGYTDAGGYGIVASAEQKGRRIILVINGLPSAKVRDQEAATLLNWGFTYFKDYKVLEKDHVVETADVWSGAKETVPLVAGQDVSYTLPRSQKKDLQVKISYDAPLAAPLKKGQEVGVVEVTVPEKGIEKFPLYVGEDVDKAPFFQRFFNSVNYLLWGKVSS